jgi:hypothetical protein
MHIAEGRLKAYLDQELGRFDLEQVQAHLGGCARCRQRASALAEQAGQVQARLVALDPQPTEAPRAVAAARACLEARLQNAHKENHSMFHRLFSRQYRLAWASLAVLVALSIALAFPSVRAVANTFLGLFRVEKITVVRFDQEDLNARLQGVEQFGQFISEDQIQQEQIGESLNGVSREEASAAAGIPLRLPTAILEGEPTLDVQPGERVTARIDLPKARALLHQLGVKGVDLPADLDGQTVTLTVSPAVMAYYGDCKRSRNSGYGSSSNCTMLVQTAAPEISAPPGLDIVAIGQAMLQVLGMSPEEAAQFSQTVDWSNTLVLPMPSDTGDYREVTVDGVQGILLESYYYTDVGKRSYSSLVWIKDGIAHLLEARGRAPNLYEIANSLR